MATVTANECKGNDVSPGDFITRPSDLAARILEWKAKGYHVLSPAIQVSSFAPDHGVNVAFVYLNPDVDDLGRGLDVYYAKADMKIGERAPSKIGLSRLASAAGVSWIGQQSGRRDPMTIQNLWIYQVVGHYLAFDGTRQTIQGEKEIDYRDGSAGIGEWSREEWRALLARNPQAKDINGWSEQRVRKARMNGAERAETGAWERAMRSGFGIKHVYTIDELKRPFVALRFSPIFDMADRDVRLMVAENALGGVAALYAGSRRDRPALNAPADVIDITTRRPEPTGALRTGGVPPGAETYPAEGTQRAPASSGAPAGAPTTNSQLPTPNGGESKPQAPSPKAEASPQVELPAAGVTPANFIKAVNPKAVPYGRNNPKHGQSFTKYIVVDGNGVEHVTVRSAIGKKAIEARDEQAPVVIHSAMNNFRELELSDITPFETAAQPVRPVGDLRL